jgi:glycosyltransferase involved in cell wall biosynthesis
MIVHILSTSKKSRLIRYAHLADLIDRYVVYCSWQRDFICEKLGVAPAHVLLSTFMVDTRFFDSSLVALESERMICAAGLERRDYPTLMKAVDGLDVRVVIAAASPWSKRADSTSGYSLPDNVEIRKLDLFELRELYARSRFVVMPLEKVEFQAGITTILEAMSMGRAVICTRTPGQTDTVIDGETGEYVPPSDAPALRTVILTMLDDEVATRKLGAGARKWVVANAEVDYYAARLALEVSALRRFDGGRSYER